MTIQQSPFDFVALLAELETSDDPKFSKHFIEKVAQSGAVQSKLIKISSENAIRRSTVSNIILELPIEFQKATAQAEIIEAIIGCATCLDLTVPPEDQYDAAKFILATALQTIKEINMQSEPNHA